MATLIVTRPLRPPPLRAVPDILDGSAGGFQKMYHQFTNSTLRRAKPAANEATIAVWGIRRRWAASAITQNAGKITTTNRGIERSGRGGDGKDRGVNRLPAPNSRNGRGRGRNPPKTPHRVNAPP